MGCGNSAAFKAFTEKPEFPDLMRQFQAMQFSKSEVRRLYEVFHAADVDGSGSIALAELLVHIDMERTPFTEKIFSIFDDDKSGEIDFKEFVLSLWNYCTLTKNTLGTHKIILLLYLHHLHGMHCPLCSGTCIMLW
jgi:hypothetical protein